jgi:uncharacterized protein YukE
VEGVVDTERRPIALIASRQSRAEQQQERRRDAKARYQDYQQRAREEAQAINRVLGRAVVEVSAHPTVHEVEEGAFVEAVVWVPREVDPS